MVVVEARLDGTSLPMPLRPAAEAALSLQKIMSGWGAMVRAEDRAPMVLKGMDAVVLKAVL